MMSDALKRNASMMRFGSEMNQLDFFVRQIIAQMVSTSIPVRVDSVERGQEGSAALYVDVTPLICQTDADGNALPSVSIPHLPYFRLQHGTAGIICDPVPGDVGLAVFAQQDCSTLSGQTEPVQPGSFRCLDMSDGFYLGGFWGQKLATFVHVEQDGTIHVVAPESHTTDSPTVIVNCKKSIVNSETTTVNASDSVKIDTPSTTITGDVKILKTLAVTGHISGSGGLSVSGGGGATVSGDMKASGDVTAGGISLQGHTHTCPDGKTSSAQ